MQIGKAGMKSSLFADDMSTYIGTHKKYTQDTRTNKSM